MRLKLLHSAELYMIAVSRSAFCCDAEVAGADLAALAYVWRMRRMNLAGSRAAAAPSAPAAPAADGLAASWGLNWADKTFGQGLSSLTKGASLDKGLGMLIGTCGSLTRACCSATLCACCSHGGLLSGSNGAVAMFG